MPRFDWSITMTVAEDGFLPLRNVVCAAGMYRQWLTGEFDPPFQYEPHPWLGFDDDRL
jgi:hypothetical protein